MFEDRYGLAVTTSSSAAFELFEQSLDRTLALRGGTRPLLEAAVEIDEGFALAWSMLGVLLRGTGDLAGGAELLARAVSLSDSVTAREQPYRRALDLRSGAIRGRANCGGRTPRRMAERRGDLDVCPLPLQSVRR